ncbi:MAG: hypothetical protein M3R63_13045 [Actinomycetota bacterium]|nr:hypothetical protein [Actinomycetota bacterium]
MEATAPLWLGVLLAVLAPVSALGAAVWTQRAADRRANREADRRDTAEQLTLYAQQRRECYVQLLVTASACMDAQRWWSANDLALDRAAEQARHDMFAAVAAVNLLGSEQVRAAARAYSNAITRDFRRRGEQREPLSHERARQFREVFEAAARTELPGVEPDGASTT